MAAWPRYARRNPTLAFGLALLLALGLFSLVGPLFDSSVRSQPLSVPPSLPPSFGFPLGTDRAGRDLLAVMITGTPLTLWIGLVGRLMGLVIGTVLAFVSGYYGGGGAHVLKSVVDGVVALPPILVLLILAVSS